jgi:ribosome maturation factor RimP
MAAAQDTQLVERITELCERAAAGTEIEIAEIQLRGGGKARLLRVYIDKPAGVTHGDCELISERLGKLLDDESIMPEESYTLEVSSPGVERKLSKPRDFERVVGRKVRIALREPLAGHTRVEGKLAHVGDGVLDLEIAPDELVHIPLDQVQKANLKFEW